jgi:catechol 2,3-dioxygenase-like lactoylglutathione lyase family enzyme
MTVSRFEHVLILAEDLEATKDFFADVVGLSVGKRPDFPFPGYWMYLGDSPCVHLAAKKLDEGGKDYLDIKDPDVSGSGCIDHIAFLADDMAGFRARLEAAGIPLRHRHVPGSPVQQIFIKDPNNVTVELNFPAGG